MSQLIVSIATLLLLSTGVGPKVLNLVPAERFALLSFTPLDAVFTNTGQIIALAEGFDSASKERVYSLNQWDIQKRSWQRSVPVEFDRRAASSPDQCNKIAYLQSSNIVIVCSDGYQLAYVDARTLTTTRKIVLDNGERALSFSAAEALGVVFVETVTPRQTVVLRQYQLRDGSLVQESKPDIDISSRHRRSFSVSPDGSTVIISGDVFGRSSTHSEVFVCRHGASMSCKSITSTMPIAGAAFDDDDAILFVSSSFADRTSGSRSQCIEKLSLVTFAFDATAYCRPGFGVHYSLAHGEGFVVGYSGYASYNWFTENTGVVASTLSVWDAKSGHLLATAALPETPTVHQSSARIIADTSGRKDFLFFNVVGGVPEMLLFDLNSGENKSYVDPAR